MTKRLSKSFSFIWIALLVFWFPSLLRAGGPTEEIRMTVEKAVTVLKDPLLQAQNKRKERRHQIRQVLLPQFDFNEMAKRSLGAHWRRRTPEEQREFVDTFTDLLEHAYIEKIEAYDDEKFLYTRESVDKDFAEVYGKILTRKGEEFSVNYKLHHSSQGWKVYDVVIENISLVNNYRDQFNRIITNSSYEDLIRRMKEKKDALVEGRK